MKKFWQKVKTNVIESNERGARQSVLEDMFNDFNRNRFSVYKFNFFRGIFFGVGSVLGATVVVALIIWLLSAIGFLVPALADLIQNIVNVMDKTAH